MKITEPRYQWAYALTPRQLTTHLIVHHSAGNGTAEGIHAYHKSLGWAGIAYHYYVRKSGEIVRGRPENMRGGHTKGMNYCSIGVCFEGNFEQEHMGPDQAKAGAELILDICKRHPGIVIGPHRDYGSTSCPGKYFPITLLSEPEPSNTDAEEKDEPAEWAKEAFDWATNNGIIKGDERGMRYNDPVTRQEFVTMLYRYHNMNKEV